MKFKSFLLSAITIIIPLSANAVSEKNSDRWFEVEVILFNQLGDKNTLNEHFPETSALPKYRRTLDLLANYLNPDIASLKQLLPNCEYPQYKADLVSQQAKLPALFIEKSLAQLSVQPSKELTSAEIPSISKKYTTESNNISDSTTTSNVADSTANGSVANEITTEQSYQEKAKIQKLVLAAEQEFSEFTFQYTTDNINNATHKFLCRIDQAKFADIKANTPSINYNGFSIKKMPLLINANEDPYTNDTHLLSQESLQLSAIIKDLKYSKNFRPLLHIGWRQVARSQKKSIPVKIYAGDNFSADYQEKLNRFEQKLLTVKKLNELNSNINNDSSNDSVELEPKLKPEITVLSAAKQLDNIKKARIADIVEQISQVPEDTTQLLHNMNNEDLSLPINTDDSLINQVESAPIPPVQNWFLEGLFNVHLKHYLFITADFNILDKNLSELATAQVSTTEHGNGNTQPTPVKAIRFKQNRRVISGEVHYFDHPYIGMLVQIRPYKKPEPPLQNGSEQELASELKTTN